MSENVEVHLGIDDTDSVKGGCTTYIASIISQRLAELGAIFIDYPCLVRLNPNIPWKTRGNGAVALRFKLPQCYLEKVLDEALRILKGLSALSDAATNPALVVTKGPPPLELRKLAKKALSSVIEVEEALRVANNLAAEVHYLKQPRGVVGALSAIGEVLEGDHTYELIAYRAPEFRGLPRRVDEDSVLKMDLATRPYTFNNIDLERKRVLITPRGPDPVLYGIRGESPEIVKQAQRLLRVNEVIERWTLFRTNQGTDAHIRTSTTKALPYEAVAIRGVVVSKPVVIRGGHVVFKLRDLLGTIDCAAYEPTGDFKKVVKCLLPGDEVIAYGGIKPPRQGHPKTLNLEKILIVKLTPLRIQVNPYCQACGATLKSLGKSKGYRCKKCGKKYLNLRKRETSKPRVLAETLYIPPPRAHRHLTKPYSRYGQEKAKPSFRPPLSPSDFLWINSNIN
ncbi:MAG: tRNA(Ile)(2)-agmatinylcytidine synthase [Candidatus Nezhaarchaeota archaeon]|nr:tRNA(Ile)(2)-agmatinylcytidine synthase [Candidatus Nezhaarchaeota archaeon]